MIVALYLVMALAFAGAWHIPHDWPCPRNRTAWALLASVALCLTLDWRGVEFDAAFWWLIDVLVIAVIYRRGMPRADWIILALFPVAWAAYFLPNPWRYEIALAVVIAQLLLTVPYAAFWGRLKRMPKLPDRWSDFDLMVSA